MSLIMPSLLLFKNIDFVVLLMLLSCKVMLRRLIMVRVMTDKIVRTAIRYGRCLTCKETELLLNDGLCMKAINRISRFLSVNRLEKLKGSI